jgi:hypothetical protein
MTVTLTSTVIVLDPRAADNNPSGGTAMPINLCRHECRPFKRWRCAQSRHTDLERRPRAQSNRFLRAAADPGSPAAPTKPRPLSP